MLFAIICTDKKNSLDLRKRTREQHLDYIKPLGDRLKLAGPFYQGDDMGDMNGSLLVVETDTLEQARKIAAADPYAQAGLFETVEIRPWNLLINRTSE